MGNGTDTEPIQLLDLSRAPEDSDPVQFDRHSIIVCDHPVISWNSWGGGRLREYHWSPGLTFAFLPARTSLVTQKTTPYVGACALLRDDILFKVGSEVVDLDSIQLDFRRVVFPPIAQIIASFRLLASAGSLTGWPMLEESAAISLGGALLTSLLPRAGASLGVLPDFTGSRLSRVLDYIEDNIGRQITVAELAGVAALSQYHFIRSFQRATGESPLRYVSTRRVELAKRALENKAMIPLTDVALQCGFCSQAHMTTVFKRMVGVTPGEYRRVVIGRVAGVVAVLAGVLADWGWFGVVVEAAI